MEEQLDNGISTLIEQIGSCGQSLLEIIDHLLDFSNLRNQRLTKGAVGSSKVGRKFLASNDDIPEDDLSAMKTGVALDDLTKEAVVSTVYSFFYDHNAEDRIQTSVILDIERSDNAAWQCQIATGGWKRVVIILVTNALKNTPAGYVRVTLRRKVKPGSRRKFNAVLSVADSGKGISQDFQKHHLFQDFSQEDSLSNGLGLGMHMVSRMVSAMGGTVAVVSDQKGSGTRVSVTVPLENHSGVKSFAEASSASLFRSLTGALKVGIVVIDQTVPLTRNDRLTAASWSMAIASIGKNLEYLGLRPQRCNLREGNSFDLKVVLDIDLDACLQALQDEGTSVGYRDFAPMLVICHNSPSAQELRRSWADDFLSTKLAVDFVALPCGMKQIARAVTYTRKLFEELNGTSSDLQSYNGPTANDPKNSDTTARETTIGEQASQQSPKGHQSADEIANTNSNELSSLPPAATPHEAPASLAATSFTHLQKSRASTSHEVPEESTPAQSPAANSAIPPTLSTADGPVLLLVDDNKINLQLLVAFAKKSTLR